MQKLGDYKLPQFFKYPPYFTFQPVKETREKQCFTFSWSSDICRFVAGSLSHEAREIFLSALVSEELHGMDRTILMRALKLLEGKGKLAIFKGSSTDDGGVKFSV
ncbi:hypothetical protein ACFE04_006403 [Oxalis oulophora]